MRHGSDLQGRLESILDEFPVEQQGTTHVADGDASADTILRDMPGHDLVLVGTNGRQGLSRVLHGSVAESVVRASRVPVLVVRGTIPATGDPRVLVAVDVFDTEARALVRTAVDWARRLGAKLDLVHVVMAPVADRNSLPSHRIWADALDGLGNLVSRRLGDLAREVPDEVRGTCRLESGDPSIAIAELSKSYALVIVRTHGRHGVGRLLFGSVSEHVVRYSKGPVLVLPAAPLRKAA
jgi:nucleotide-binding universal stress UspA family protein